MKLGTVRVKGKSEAVIVKGGESYTASAMPPGTWASKDTYAQ